MRQNLTYLTISDYSDTLMYQLVSKKRSIVIALAIFIVAILTILNVVSQIHASPYSDSAYYLVVAKSLSQGTGLRLISVPELPFTTIAPPAYAFFLSFFVRIFGLESTVPYRSISLILWLGSLVLIWYLVKQEDGRFWGFLLTFLMAINLYMMEYAKEILTEVPYIFFSFLAIILAYKYIKSQEPQKWKWLIPLVFILFILLHLRMVAVTLVAATSFYFILRKEWQIGFLIATILGLSYLPWVFTWKQQAAPVDQWFVRNTRYEVDAEEKSFGEIVTERITSNTTFYIEIARRNVLGFHYFSNASVGLYRFLDLFVLALIFIGWFVKLRSLQTFLVPLYMFFYMLILIVVLPAGIDRYLIPLTPFPIWYFLVGLATLIGVLGKKLSVGLPRLRLIFFTCSIAIVYIMLMSTSLVALIKLPILLGEAPPNKLDVRSYVEAASWLKDNTPPGSIILSRKTDTVYLQSDRQGFRYPFTPDQKLMMSFLVEYDVSYVILDSLYPSTVRFLAPFLEDNREMFEEVYRTPDNSAVVFRFKRELLEE